ncbi:hypothetical protein, partial [Actinacidiphila rubida]|uniref:hypothetical protein n=1 Tax=Actinacidiphila rubida TaxID=310780 RepID=UPI001C405FC4
MAIGGQRGAGVGAQIPEEPLGLRRERAVRPGEDGTHVDPPVPGRQRVQPRSGRAQLAQADPQRHPRRGGELRADDGHRERQVAAQLDEFGGRLGLRRAPLLA